MPSDVGMRVARGGVGGNISSIWVDVLGVGGRKGGRNNLADKCNAAYGSRVQRVELVMVGSDDVTREMLGKSNSETIGERDFSDFAFEIARALPE